MTRRPNELRSSALGRKMKREAILLVRRQLRTEAHLAAHHGGADRDLGLEAQKAHPEVRQLARHFHRLIVGLALEPLHSGVDLGDER